MLTNPEKRFAQKVVALGYATAQQVEDAIKVQDKLVELGIEKDLAGVMLDKKYISPRQAVRVHQHLDYESVKEHDKVFIKLLKKSGLISDEQLADFRKTQKRIAFEGKEAIPDMQELVMESGLLSKEQLRSLNLHARTMSFQKIERQKIHCSYCDEQVIPIDYRCPQCNNIIQFEFQELDLPETSSSSKAWFLKFYNRQEGREVEIETECDMIKDWIMTGFVTREAFVKQGQDAVFEPISKFEIFASSFEAYDSRQQAEKLRRWQEWRQHLKYALFIVLPLALLIVWQLQSSPAGKSRGSRVSHGAKRPGRTHNRRSSTHNRRSSTHNRRSSNQHRCATADKRSSQGSKRLASTHRPLPSQDTNRTATDSHSPAPHRSRPKPASVMVNFRGHTYTLNKLRALMQKSYGQLQELNYHGKTIEAYVLTKGPQQVRVFVMEGPLQCQHQEVNIDREEYERILARRIYLEKKRQLRRLRGREQKFHAHFDLAMWAKRKKLYPEMRQELLYCYQLNKESEQVRQALGVILPGEIDQQTKLCFFPRPFNFWKLHWQTFHYQPELPERVHARDYPLAAPPVPDLVCRMYSILPDPEVAYLSQGQIKYWGRWYPARQLQNWRHHEPPLARYQCGNLTVYTTLADIDGRLAAFIKHHFPKCQRFVLQVVRQCIPDQKQLDQRQPWCLLLARDSRQLEGLRPYVQEGSQVLAVILPDVSELEHLCYPLLVALTKQLCARLIATDIPWLKNGMAQMVALSYPDQQYQKVLFWDDAFAKIVLESLLHRGACYDCLRKMKNHAVLHYPTPYYWFMFAFLYHQYPESLKIYLRKMAQGHKSSFEEEFALLLNNRRSWRRYAFTMLGRILEHTSSLGVPCAAHVMFFQDVSRQIMQTRSLEEHIRTFIRRFEHHWSGMTHRGPALLEAWYYRALLAEQTGLYRQAYHLYQNLAQLYRSAASQNEFSTVVQSLTEKCEQLKNHLD